MAGSLFNLAATNKLWINSNRGAKHHIFFFHLESQFFSRRSGKIVYAERKLPSSCGLLLRSHCYHSVELPLLSSSTYQIQKIAHFGITSHGHHGICRQTPHGLSPQPSIDHHTLGENFFMVCMHASFPHQFRFALQSILNLQNRLDIITTQMCLPSIFPIPYSSNRHTERWKEKMKKKKPRRGTSPRCHFKPAKTLCNRLLTWK